MSITTPIPVTQPTRKMISTGVYFDSETLSRVDAWITPAFRTRGEVIGEMARVLNEAGWRPGSNGFHPKKEAAPVSTPRAASKLQIYRKKK